MDLLTALYLSNRYGMSLIEIGRTCRVSDLELAKNEIRPLIETGQAFLTRVFSGHSYFEVYYHKDWVPSKIEIVG